MRALTVQEIDNLAADLGVLKGATLQEVAVSSTGVGVGFWQQEQGLIWLWFEGHRWSPVLIPLNRLPRPGIKPLKPLALFIKAHFQDAQFSEVSRKRDLGRALEIKFDQGQRIEIHLWPKHANFVAFAGTKRVAWTRVTAASGGDLPHEASALDQVRNLPEILQEWTDLVRQLPKVKTSGQTVEQGRKTGNENGEKLRQDKIKRLKRAIEKVDAEIVAKRDAPWREVGDWLVQNQTLNIPEKHKPFVDRRRSLPWNIENCFHRAKEGERKLAATQLRRDQLASEIKWAESAPLQQLAKKGIELNVKKAVNKKEAKESRAKFRRILLPSGLVARVGRSAADNMQILRESRAWDYWLHLRDHPGSHAIISRERNAAVADQDFAMAGRALIEQTFPQNLKNYLGQVFTLIISECRHVHPLKGDKMGRVTFRNERTMTLRYT